MSATSIGAFGPARATVAEAPLSADRARGIDAVRRAYNSLALGTRPATTARA